MASLPLYIDLLSITQPLFLPCVLYLCYASSLPLPLECPVQDSREDCGAWMITIIELELAHLSPYETNSKIIEQK